MRAGRCLKISFHNQRFPLSVERCTPSLGGSTTVLNVGNGSEVRIAWWSDGRIEFDAAPGVRSLKDLKALVSFQRRRAYRLHSFPVRDLTDYEVALGTEGAFATGDGTAGPFQLTKTYYDADNSDVRAIRKPEQGTVKIYVNGVLKTAGTHYTLDHLTGEVTFLAGHFPAAGAVVEWTGRFFVAVRFVEDKIPFGEFVATMTLDAATNEYVVRDGSVDLPRVGLIQDMDE